ncbi:nicotinamidase-related amidase [Bacilli bacterium PM5-3]|nr:nicotinamidase-related amidase [Bacilli bacterium PM5-3]MDH6603818.1 nicotinamidase-related amidase [Bacilli bacterium PM5-9]
MILDKKNDLIVMIDMINGFSYEGAFASENIINLIPNIKKFVKDNIDSGVEVIHYIDSHPNDAQEFNSYPPHCLENSSEAQVINDLDFNEIELIKKNSTNGFMAKNPFDYNKNLYIIGCVTDICIFEFALSAQKYKEERNLEYTVNIISDLVDTFDSENHDSKEINKQFLNILKTRGVNII